MTRAWPLGSLLAALVVGTAAAAAPGTVTGRVVWRYVDPEGGVHLFDDPGAAPEAWQPYLRRSWFATRPRRTATAETEGDRWVHRLQRWLGTAPAAERDVAAVEEPAAPPAGTGFTGPRPGPGDGSWGRPPRLTPEQVAAALQRFGGLSLRRRLILASVAAFVSGLLWLLLGELVLAGLALAIWVLTRSDPPRRRWAWRLGVLAVMAGLWFLLHPPLDARYRRLLSTWVVQLERGDGARAQ